MTSAPSPANHTSAWIEEFRRQLRRGRHVLIHGSVRDRAVFDGNFGSVRDAIDDTLAGLGYDLRIHHDPVDGMTYGDPKGMPTLYSQRHPGPPVPTLPAGPLALWTALERARALLAYTGQGSSACVFHLADKFMGPGENQSPDERSQLVLVSRVAEGASLHTTGPQTGMRNALVLVAPAIGQIPAWLYRDNPYFVVIEVRRPERDDRLAYFGRQAASFYGGSDSKVSTEGPGEVFCDLTEGMSFHDLEAIRLTSLHEGIPLGEMAKLIDQFKHGKHEDPWEALGPERIQEAAKTLEARVIGQPKAIEAVERVLISARGGILLEGAGRRSARPKGVLFFVGPTGVGKTELAKALTELVFSDERAFARFDMSEYQQEHSVQRLVGAPPSYVGFEQGGELTNRMRTRPFSVVLFDEIEKAHPRVLDIFLQILDEGRLTDSRGETVYFSQSVIIFTSNIGSTKTVARTPGSEGPSRIFALDSNAGEWTPEKVAEYFRERVPEYFAEIGRPELLGRIGSENIIPFDMLRKEFIAPILSKFFANIQASAREKYDGLAVDFDASVVKRAEEYCIRREQQLFGGRAIRNFVQEHVLGVVNREALNSRGLGKRGGRLVISVTPDGKIVATEAK